MASSIRSSSWTATSSAPLGFQNRITAILPSLRARSTSSCLAGVLKGPLRASLAFDRPAAPAAPTLAVAGLAGAAARAFEVLFAAAEVPPVLVAEEDELAGAEPL